jgi:hypothetical protein
LRLGTTKHTNLSTISGQATRKEKRADVGRLRKEEGEKAVGKKEDVEKMGR